MRVSIIAKSLWGYNYTPSTENLAKDDAELQGFLTEELGNSDGFVLCTSGESDIQIEALQHEADDAGNKEGPMLITGVTLGLIPAWYDRELILEVRATSRDGRTRGYNERDSYTRMTWLPLSPFALFWSSSGAFRDMAKKQFARALEKLEGDLAASGA